MSIKQREIPCKHYGTHTVYTFQSYLYRTNTIALEEKKTQHLKTGKRTSRHKSDSLKNTIILLRFFNVSSFVNAISQ